MDGRKRLKQIIQWKYSWNISWIYILTRESSAPAERETVSNVVIAASNPNKLQVVLKVHLQHNCAGSDPHFWHRSDFQHSCAGSGQGNIGNLTCAGSGQGNIGNLTLARLDPYYFCSLSWIARIVFVFWIARIVLGCLIARIVFGLTLFWVLFYYCHVLSLNLLLLKFNENPRISCIFMMGEQHECI